MTVAKKIRTGSGLPLSQQNNPHCLRSLPTFSSTFWTVPPSPSDFYLKPKFLLTLFISLLSLIFQLQVEHCSNNVVLSQVTVAADTASTHPSFASLLPARGPDTELRCQRQGCRRATHLVCWNVRRAACGGLVRCREDRTGHAFLGQDDSPVVHAEYV